MTRADAMGRLLSFVARLITGAQGHWRGCPPKAEQRIYFANHQSHLDWVLIWAALPRELRATTRPIAARDYWTSSPFKHWLTREVFNAVYVNRQRTDDQDPLEPLLDALANGDSLVIFPEGTRSAKGLPQPFKSGLYHLARQYPQVPLVPAWIANVQRVMPKGEVVPVPILCTVTFGEPLLLRTVDGQPEDKAGFLARAREAVIALQPEGSVAEASA
ncbi:MAG: 1-acyl-sn-glycerol-3-phosphate acyltransferase [Burkholderiaceae bacterium]|nr:1-acyl-sn-glycerol-3-phosphate acyltransferase [Burkholderiaceae bacterium]